MKKVHLRWWRYSWSTPQLSTFQTLEIKRYSWRHHIIHLPIQHINCFRWSFTLRIGDHRASLPSTKRWVERPFRAPSSGQVHLRMLGECDMDTEAYAAKQMKSSNPLWGCKSSIQMFKKKYHSNSQQWSRCAIFLHHFYCEASSNELIELRLGSVHLAPVWVRCNWPSVRTQLGCCHVGDSVVTSLLCHSRRRTMSTLWLMVR